MRRIKLLLSVLLCVILFFTGRYFFYMLPVFSAGAAKISCSCIYVGGRTLENVQKNELAYFPLNLNKIQIDEDRQTVTASIFGLAHRKAIYREGLGCTLVIGITEEEIRKQEIAGPPALAYNPDTLQWPAGNIIDSTFFQATEYKGLKKVVSNAFAEMNSEKPINTRAIVVVHKGRIVAEEYADGFKYDQPQLGWSMTKSFSNALIGILIRDGKLKLTNKNLLPKWQDPRDPRSEITLDHLLKMSSGLQWDESYFSWSPVVEMVYTQAKMSDYASSLPLEYKPGEKWEYSSGTTNILFDIIKNATGKNYHAFIYERLFHKIGMSRTVIELDGSGGFVGSTFGWATPRDWARFGLLYLNEGRWQGEQIISKEWIKYSSTPSSQAPNGTYAAQFWHISAEAPQAIPSDLYYAHGFEGQRVIIIPSKELVIVRLGQTHFENFEWNDFIVSILASL
jgi:CubicO group peptidase (beta-lactamase class C family)